MGKRRSRSYIVIGLGRFGSSLAVSLTELGHEVLGVDTNMDVLEELKEELHEVVQLDATNPRALADLGIADYDTCIVGRGEDLGDSISITMNLRDLGAKHIIAKAVTERHARVLEKIGADDVVFPERDMGHRLAHTIGTARVSEFFELSPHVSVLEVQPPPSTHHQTLIALALRPRLGITVIGIRRGEALIPGPSGDAVIEPGDRLVVLGEESAIEEWLSGS